MISTSGAISLLQTYLITFKFFLIMYYKVFDSIIIMFRALTMAVKKFGFSGGFHPNDHQMLSREMLGICITNIRGGVGIHSRGQGIR